MEATIEQQQHMRIVMKFTPLVVFATFALNVATGMIG